MLDRYRDLAMIATDWLWETDRDHRICWLLDSPNHPLTLGQTFWDIADSAETADIWTRQRVTMKSHRPFGDVQFPLVSADGRRKWFSMNGRPFADANGRFAGYRGSLADITDRRRNAINLSESLALKRRLLDTTQEGYWLLDLNEKIVDVNPAMCRLLGHDRGGIIGRSIYDFLDTENAEIHHAEANLRSLGVDGSHEISMIRADGGHIPLLCSTTPIHDSHDRLVGLATFHTDITALKDTQRRLEEAHIEAEAANRAKSSFLATMSHELRTPLNAIIGFSQLLRMQYRDLLDPDGIDKLDSITRAGQALHDIISRILDLSKIQSERLAADLTDLHVPTLIDQIVQDLAPLAENHAIRIILERKSLEGVHVRGDRAGLSEVLANLVANAVQYNRQGGTVTIEGQSRKDGFRIIVHDTGYGIPRDQQTQVFQSFTRLNRNATAIGGAGLGLAVSRALIRAMNGQIGFSSRPAKGSSFWIDLPRATCNDDHPSPTLDGKDDTPPVPAGHADGSSGNRRSRPRKRAAG